MRKVFICTPLWSSTTQLTTTGYNNKDVWVEWRRLKVKNQSKEAFPFFDGIKNKQVLIFVCGKGNWTVCVWLYAWKYCWVISFLSDCIKQIHCYTYKATDKM